MKRMQKRVCFVKLVQVQLHPLQAEPIGDLGAPPKDSQYEGGRATIEKPRCFGERSFSTSIDA